MTDVAPRPHVAGPPAHGLVVPLPRQRGAIAALVVVSALMALGAWLDGGALLLEVDEPLQRAVVDHRSPALDDFFLTVTRLGNAPAVFALAAILCWLAWRPCPALVAAIMAATLARPIYETVLKEVIGRERPDIERLVTPGGQAFPSGHVLAVVALWGLVPAVVSLRTSRPWARRTAAIVAAAVVLLVAASRVYLGVHWTTDALGGIVIGVLALVAVERLVVSVHERAPSRCVHERAPARCAGAGPP